MRETLGVPKTKIAQIVLWKIAPISVALLILLHSTACHKKQKAHTAVATRIGAIETGMASWYGYPYHGRRAANGEIYDMEKLTAAHRTLPFDTWVEVRNISNGKFVNVRITDRGPFVDGRVIDVSKAAAREIDLLGPGVARVRLTIVSPPPAAERPVNVFAVQIGAFREKDRAERLRLQYEQQFGSANIVLRNGDPSVWRVLVGRATSSEGANELLGRVLEKTQPAFLVRLDDVARLTN